MFWFLFQKLSDVFWQDIVKAVLKTTQSLTNAVNDALQSGASDIAQGLNQVGKGTTNAVSSIIGGTVQGVGATLNSAPAAVYHTTKNLENTALLGTLFNTLTVRGIFIARTFLISFYTQGRGF